MQFRHLDVVWDDSYKHLDYSNEPFNNTVDTDKWLAQGYSSKFTGDMCDMRKPQPIWNQQILRQFEDMGWQDVCSSYYRMSSGTVLPVHVDTYKRYIELFGVSDPKLLRRGLVFLEDWSSGHYLEVDYVPVVGWKKGDCYIWYNDTPHMAANIGMKPRYTLQITGHVCE